MNLISGPRIHIIRPQDIIVAQSIIKPRIKSSLEQLVITSDKSKDRERALNLLSLIEDQNKRLDRSNNLVKENELKNSFRRPKTAYSRLKGRPTFNSFATAYNEDYPKKIIKETIAVRPPSTDGIITRPTEPLNKQSETKDKSRSNNDDENDEKLIKSCYLHNRNSTYTVDFCSNSKNDLNNFNHRPQTRAATASGVRCNNPHPNKEFLVWRIPRDSFGKERRAPGETPLKANMENNFAQITDDQFNRVMRGNCRSTYQNDFLGGEAPVDQISPFYLHPEIKTGQRLKLSTQQVDFDRPAFQQVELSVPKDRYSSNRSKYDPAKGIIPFVTNKTYMNTFGRTTYDEDINDRADAVYRQIINDNQNKVNLNQLRNIKDLERAMMEAGNVEDKETLERIFQKLNKPEDFKRISFVKKPFYNTGRMSWVSNYPGPL